ncbi:MAG: SDR family oxidoreductase [Proteobacteria bacterium]|nr:SDR family oxidoreductase [Pseudomonadota bacterium]
MRDWHGTLSGRVAVVIGGAGGIGSAICDVLARADATVVVTYHQSDQAARQLVQRLGGGGAHRALRASVTDSATLARLASSVDDSHGRCDLLINCAGVTRFVPHGDLDGLDDALIDDILRTNVRGPFAAARAFKPLLARSDNALVVNISSIAARTATGSNVMYCASKAALDNMTQSLARALAPAIRVVSVAPGLVDTEFVRGLDPRWRDEQAARTPLGRLATAEEIGLAVLAASVGLPYSTGIVIPVDGGRPLVLSAAVIKESQRHKGTPMANRKILIKHGTLMTLDPRHGVFGGTWQGDVLIDGSRLARVESHIDVADAEVIDASHCLVMPGLIDTHRHVWQTALRGVTHDETLKGYMREIRFLRARAYHAQDIYVGNYVGMLEAINAGITSV